MAQLRSCAHSLVSRSDQGLRNLSWSSLDRLLAPWPGCGEELLGRQTDNGPPSLLLYNEP